ncbi:hypothetical protein ADL02_31110 [Streptomyces sp. NRRL WC-3723]|nr:hypothetical protein ADL02_31110 [Streptomyces sp. NRRL WC-3723]
MEPDCRFQGYAVSPIAQPASAGTTARKMPDSSAVITPSGRQTPIPAVSGGTARLPRRWLV